MKRIKVALICVALCVFTANATTFTWNGNGGNSNWTTVANWDKNASYPATSADYAYVSAADALYIDVGGILEIKQLTFAPAPARRLTVTGDTAAAFRSLYFTVGSASVLDFKPDINLIGTGIKDGSGVLAVLGNLTTSGKFYINDGELRVDGGNAIFNDTLTVGNATYGYPASLCLTNNGTMQWNKTVFKAGSAPLIRLSGGTLQVAAGGSCSVPLLIDGANTIETTPVMTASAGLSITQQGHLFKRGAGGLIIGAGTTNFVAGGLTITNSYMQFSMNSVYESYGGSTEPWHVRVCNGGRFFVGGYTTVFTVPLDLVMEPGGTVEFPGDFGANYNVLVAHSITTNGVALTPGRYKAGSGFIKSGGLGSVVLATRWTGAGDGVSWFDADNWSGAIPNGASAVADISNAQAPITLGAQNVTLTCLVYNPQGTQRAGSVTGSGTLSLYVPATSDGCLVVGPGRTLTLDVDIARASGSGSSLGIFGNGTVIVKKNFPAGVPCVSLMGNLVFDGTTEVLGETLPLLGVVAATRPVTYSTATTTNLFDATVTFATNCHMTVNRLFSNPKDYYPVRQIIHDGAEIVCTSKGYVFLTRYADDYMVPFTYFMRAGKLTVPSDSLSGVSLGCVYTSGWEAIRRGGASFVMTGGEVTTPKFQLGTPEDVLTLQGGDVYLNSGGIVSTTNGFQGTINLGGVAIHAAANWGSLLNLTMTGAGGPTLFDTTNKIVTLSGTLAGPGGMTKQGSGTLTLSGANTFTGNVTVAGGTLVADNGLVNATNLFVTALGAMLTIGSADSLNTNATLNVAQGGVVNLNFSGTVTVYALVVDGEAKSPGTYNNGKPYITGAGTLRVLNGPPLQGTILSIW